MDDASADRLKRHVASRIFGPGDGWLDRVREAESPLPFGCLGPYELEEEISRGGQGIVFRARQPGTHRRVAVKRLLGGSFATPGMRRRFEREVEALTALNHPHIVTIFAMDVVDGVPVLAMEWIDGVPITRWAKDTAEGQRGPRLIVRMLLTVCDAVHHAHQRGVIHRDLKPSNILIDGSQTPHIVDFGLAKFSRPSAERPSGRTGQFVGTLAYASPEQLHGEDDKVDVRSDVYALGVILFELLTGELPYDLGDDLAGAAEAIERTEPIRPGRLVENLDRDLEAIVLKAMAKDRLGRYQSAETMAADLRRFLTGEPVSARPPGGWDQLRNSFRRHRVTVGLTLTALIVVSLFAVITGALAIRLAEQRDLAESAQRSEASARQNAERQSARAQTINSFLQDMLAAADPRRVGDAQLTVREVLDAAAARIDAELSGQDEVKAELNGLVGRTYQNLGLLDAAESHMRSALTLYQSLPGDHREMTLNLMADLATALHSKGDHSAAGTITEQAVGLYRELLAEGRPLLKADVDGMAGYYFVKRQYAAAKVLYEEALLAHRKTFGDGHLVVAGDLAGLAMLHAELGEIDLALSLAHEGGAIIRGIPDAESPELAETTFDLARVLHETKTLVESRSLYEEALTLQRRILGEDHPTVAESLSHYATLLAQLGELDAAVEAHRRSLAIQRKLFGGDHRGVGASHARLGTALFEAGRLQEAEVEFRAAVEKLERILPPGHQDIALRRHELGRCLTALARYADAEPYLLDSYPVIAGRYGEGDRRAERIRQSIIELYEAWNHPAEANEWRAKRSPTSAPQVAASE